MWTTTRPEVPERREYREQNETVKEFFHSAAMLLLLLQRSWYEEGSKRVGRRRRRSLKFSLPARTAEREMVFRCFGVDSHSVHTAAGEQHIKILFFLFLTLCFELCFYTKPSVVSASLLFRLIFAPSHRTSRDSSGGERWGGEEVREKKAKVLSPLPFRAMLRVEILFWCYRLRSVVGRSVGSRSRHSITLAGTSDFDSTFNLVVDIVAALLCNVAWVTHNRAQNSRSRQHRHHGEKKQEKKKKYKKSFESAAVVEVEILHTIFPPIVLGVLMHAQQKKNTHTTIGTNTAEQRAIAHCRPNNDTCSFSIPAASAQHHDGWAKKFLIWIILSFDRSNCMQLLRCSEIFHLNPFFKAR